MLLAPHWKHLATKLEKPETLGNPTLSASNETA